MTDVAERAHVNISTVSRTINQTGKISRETQDRIRKVMHEMGYKPNRVARRLRRRGAAHLLGLIIPNIQNPFFSDLARGVEDVAYENNFALLLANYDEDPAKELFYLDIMMAESVDGLILPPISENDPAILRAVQRGMPVVCVDRSFTGNSLDKVEVDNHRGAFDAVTHLIKQGHRLIGVICGPLDSSTGRDRQRGYQDAHAAAGLTVDPRLIRHGDYKEESGRKFAHQLLSLRDAPTALFVCNGLMTIGALETIHALGLGIPRQIAVIAFDELPLAAVFNPPLTVVRQPAYEVGKCAAELLFKRLREPLRPVSAIKLLPDLIIRQSG